MMLPSIDLAENRTVKAAGGRASGIARGKSLYYMPAGLPGAGVPSLNQLALAPLDIDRVCLLRALVGDIVAVNPATCVLRLALYTDDGSGVFPDTLVADAGTIDATVVGPVALALATPIPIPPGRYWIGGVVQGIAGVAGGFRVLGNGSALMPGTSTALNSFNYGAAQNAVSAAAPATFTTAIGYTSSVPRVSALLS